MKWMLIFVSVTLLNVSSAIGASPPQTPIPPSTLKVVVTLPVLKDFVRQIGKGRVSVQSLLSGLENQHTYTSSPKDVVMIQKADLLVKIGLGLDLWTEDLIKNTRTRGLVVLDTSKGVALIRDPDHKPSNDPSHQKKNHTIGNPHIWLDPENAKMMIEHIREVLVSLDPENESFYRDNQKAYFVKLDQLQQDLISRIKQLKNRKIITHHNAWPYFARRFGFDLRSSIIEQVGAEPSVQRMAGLIKKIKQEDIKVIISEPQLNARLPKILVEETQIKLVLLSPIPGVIEGVETYTTMIKYNVEKLLSVLED